MIRKPLVEGGKGKKKEKKKKKKLKRKVKKATDVRKF